VLALCLLGLIALLVPTVLGLGSSIAVAQHSGPIITMNPPVVF
jgi:hypothetical protein